MTAWVAAIIGLVELSDGTQPEVVFLGLTPRLITR